MSDIVITGLSTSDPLPGIYIDISFAQGPAGGSSAPHEAIILANKISTGTGVESTMVYGPDTDDPLQTEDHVKTLAGEGSEAHLMWKAFVEANPVTPVRLLLVPEGGGAVAATGTITYASNASGSGFTRVWVADEYVDVPIVSGDTPTVIATAVVAAINAKASWPVTASNIAGVITITARNKGVRGNFIRYMARVFGTSGASITTTVTPITDSGCTGGSVADDATTALATLAAGKYYYIVSALNASAQLTSQMTVVNNQALPANGNRQRLFVASCDTTGNTITLATGVNAARCELIHSQENPIGPSRLAAKAAACYAFEELTPKERTNFAGYGNDEASSKRWKCPPARSTSVRPSSTTLKSLLSNGITPIGVNSNSSTYIVNRVTTRTLSGSIPDYRISRAHKVTICDFYAEDQGAKLALQFNGMRIIDNLSSGEPALDLGKSVTPATIKAAINAGTDDYRTVLQNVDVIKEKTVVQRNSIDRTRCDIYVPLQTADNLEKFGFLVSQVA